MLRRAKTEALDLPPKTRTWQPVDVDGKRVRQLEARALAFYEAHPDRSARRGRVPRPAQQARHTWPSRRSPHTPRRSASGSRPARRSSSSPPTEPIENPRGRVRRAASSITGQDGAKTRSRRSGVPERRARPRPARQPARGRGRDHPDRRHPRRLQRPRLGARQPLAGRGPDLPHRPDPPAFVTYLVAENTLDDFVAALLEQKARTIGVLEAEAADRATLVRQTRLHRRPGVPRHPRAAAPNSAEARSVEVLAGSVTDLRPAGCDGEAWPSRTGRRRLVRFEGRRRETRTPCRLDVERAGLQRDWFGRPTYWDGARRNAKPTSPSAPASPSWLAPRTLEPG